MTNFYSYVVYIILDYKFQTILFSTPNRRNAFFVANENFIV